MIKKIRSIGQNAMEVLFPGTCPICDKTLGWRENICRKCIFEMNYIDEPRCKKCGKQLVKEETEYCQDCTVTKHYYKEGMAVFLYDDAIRQSVYRFKYHNRRTYAKFYGMAIAERYEYEIKKCQYDVIIPVPIHEKRRIKRGYNQAELIAEQVGKRLDIPVDNTLLMRIADTKPQKELNKQERKKNLENAFKITDNVVKYKKILLVDDIYTTGSTVDQCSKVLLDNGAEEVSFASLSIGAGV